MGWGIADGEDVDQTYLRDSIEAALGGGKPAQPANFTVFLDGSTYKARNGTTGIIDHSGTDAATVIQAAISALTNGGTAVLKGDGQTWLASNTIIELVNNLTLILKNVTIKLENNKISGTGFAQFRAQNKSNIEVICENSWIDMNVQNQNPLSTASFVGFTFEDCTNIKVSGVWGKNIGGDKCAGFLVQLLRTTDFFVEDLYGENLDCVLSLNSINDGIVENIRAKLWSTKDSFAGIVWVGAYHNNSKNIHLSGIHGVQTSPRIGIGVGLHLSAHLGYTIEDVTFNGIHVKAAEHPLCLELKDTGSHIKNIEGSDIMGINTKKGVRLTGVSTPDYLENINLVNVRSLTDNSIADEHNIRVEYVKDSSILGIDAEGALYECLQLKYVYRSAFQGRIKNPQRHGIGLWSDTDHCSFDFSIIDDQGAPTMDRPVNVASGCDNNHFIIHRTYGYAVGFISDAGTNNRWEGPAFKNSGTSTGTGAEQTIPHGLAGDLIPNEVSVVPTVTGATVSGVWADATNIYCTVTNGKAYRWSAEVV